MVDDDAAKRFALKAVLAPLGYRVVEADSGAAGLRCLLASDFAVILLDVRMPIMDGFETAALIRLRKESELTPIVFVTAHDPDEVMADRYAEGAVDFITAPVHPDELRAKVSVFAHLFLQAQTNAAKARELQTSADQLTLLTETAPIGIFQTDAENRYIYTNARWSSITGISAEEAVGEGWHVLIGEDQLEAVLAANDGVPAAKEFSSRLEVRAPGGSPRILMLNSRSLTDDRNEITGWVGTLADITAEAVAEAAMEEARDQATAASRLKSDFLANMSHEIRTPMNGVIGLTELLLETDLDDEQRRFTETLSKSGAALMTVINGILDFAKIEKGKLEIEDIEFGIQTLVDDVVDLLAPSAQTKGLKLMATLDDSVPAMVSGDPSRLRQVLTNLAGNAIKFTDAGEVVLRVRAAPAQGERERRAVRAHRHRLGHRPGQARDDLRAVHPGRHLHHPGVRRDGPRPGDQQPADHPDGRRGGDLQRARRREHVLVHDPGSSGRGGRRHRGNRSMSAWSASARWSWRATRPSARSSGTTSPAGAWTCTRPPPRPRRSRCCARHRPTTGPWRSRSSTPRCVSCRASPSRQASRRIPLSRRDWC